MLFEASHLEARFQAVGIEGAPKLSLRFVHGVGRLNDENRDMCDVL